MFEWNVEEELVKNCAAASMKDGWLGFMKARAQGSACPSSFVLGFD